MSLEIVGPERFFVSRSITVAAKLESSPVVGGKLEGFLGASISALLARVVGDCGDGVSGVFEAEDGAKTDPIEMSELVQGTIIHSDSSGGPLLQKQGGPLRVSFPEGVAVQESMCGTAKPINLKFAVRLTLSSHFELKDARLARQLSAAAPRFILSLAAGWKTAAQRRWPNALTSLAHKLGAELALGFTALERPPRSFGRPRPTSADLGQPRPARPAKRGSRACLLSAQVSAESASRCPTRAS